MNAEHELKPARIVEGGVIKQVYIIEKNTRNQLLKWLLVLIAIPMVYLGGVSAASTGAHVEFFSSASNWFRTVPYLESVEALMIDVAKVDQKYDTYYQTLPEKQLKYLKAIQGNTEPLAFTLDDHTKQLNSAIKASNRAAANSSNVHQTLNQILQECGEKK